MLRRRDSVSGAGAISLILTAWAVGPLPATALPIATGSQCNSKWVNNAGAMQCFIKGEEETRAGVRHPHYVACAGGDVFCCVDNDAGNQDCVAQLRQRPPTQDALIQAILAAHTNRMIALGRYTERPKPPPAKPPMKKAPR
jgi:hypothetical protein